MTNINVEQFALQIIENNNDNSIREIQQSLDILYSTIDVDIQDIQIALSTLYQYTASDPQLWQETLNILYTSSNSVLQFIQFALETVVIYGQPIKPSIPLCVQTNSSYIKVLVSGFTQYTEWLDLERALDVSGSPGTFSVVGTHVTPNAIYTDTSISSGVTTYWYRIAARNIDKVTYSDPVSVYVKYADISMGLQTTYRNVYDIRGVLGVGYRNTYDVFTYLGYLYIISNDLSVLLYGHYITKGDMILQLIGTYTNRYDCEYFEGPHSPYLMYGDIQSRPGKVISFFGDIAVGLGGTYTTKGDFISSYAKHFISTYDIAENLGYIYHNYADMSLTLGNLFNIKRDIQAQLYYAYVKTSDIAATLQYPIIHITDSGVQVSDTPYSLTPELGLIHFTQSLDAKRNVLITIIRDGAYFYNVGTNPHLEIPYSFVTHATPATTLSKPLGATDTQLFVNNPLSIPATTTYLDIVYQNTHERIGVRIDPNTNEIFTRELTRNGTAFPGSSNASNHPAQVYIVDIKTLEGIEDLISLGISGQTYNFNSLTDSNLLQLSIELNNNYVDLFKDSLGNSIPLDNTLLFDFTGSNIDTNSSSSNQWVGLEPSEIDTGLSPTTVYSIYNPTLNGIGMVVGTDQGIWEYNGIQWINTSSNIPGINRVYFITTNSDNTIIAGTNKGLIYKNGNIWVQDPVFPQALYSYLNGSAFDGKYQAYGKSDGFAFDLIPNNNPNTFISDHFDSVDGQNIYNVFYGQWLTADSNSSDDTITINKHDGIYLCTSSSIYGLASGGRGGQYSSIFGGRDMFASHPLTMISPYNSLTVPVKFYKIVQSLNTKLTHVVILTSNGVYFSKDWRWANPDDASTGGWDVYGPYVPGVSFTTFTQYQDSNNNVRMFAGGTSGVYRTFNNGLGDWDICERIGNGATVYDLQVGPNGINPRTNTANTIIYAATDNGIYYTANDGDDWVHPSIGDNNANYDYNISAGISFIDKAKNSDRWLAQTFKLNTALTSISKIGLYLSLIDIDPTSVSYTSNYLIVQIYNTTTYTNVATNTTYRVPSTAIGSPVTITPSQVKYPGFWNVAFSSTGLSSANTYALVVKEYRVSVSGNPLGISIFRWHHSGNPTQNTYNNGYMLYGGASVNWLQDTTNPQTDFFFKIYELNNPQATYTTVMADFTTNTTRGLVVNDSGYLTTDFKIMAACVLDDSQSASWSDTQYGINNQYGRAIGLENILVNLWNYTASIVDGEKYYPSYADIWIYDNDSIERTNGYINDISVINTAVNALHTDGLLSDIFGTSMIAISGLSPQSIISAVFNYTDIISTNNKVQQIVDDLNNKGILKLNNIIAYDESISSTQNPSTWDQQVSTIGAQSINSFDSNGNVNNSGVAWYVVNQWANTFTPIVLILGDGDNSNTENTAINVAVAAQSAYNDGCPIYTFGLGTSHNEINLRTISDSTGGKHFDVSSPETDWPNIALSFLHGGKNNLFVGTWEQDYDFDDLTWVDNIKVVFTLPYVNNGDIPYICTVEYRFTTDRTIWTSWKSIPLFNSNVPQIIQENIYALQLRITLGDGWDITNKVPLKPIINSLTYDWVVPGIQYRYTNPQITNNGIVSQYILSASANIPKTSEVQWGIARGNSTDFADYELVLNGYKNILPNRQSSILFTTPPPPVISNNVVNTNGDTKTYNVLDNNNNPIKWLTTNVVQVEQISNLFPNGQTFNPNTYKADGNSSVIVFNDQLPNNISLRVTIYTPSVQQNLIGETTTTLDRRTYYLINGRWPFDAQVVVLVNSNIVRGGYFLSNENGTVTFKRELDVNDVVTVYVQHSNIYRVGVQVKDYSIDNTVTFDNFGLFYSLQQNSNILALSRSGLNPPTIAQGTLAIKPSSPTYLVADTSRMWIQYKFVGYNNSPESGSSTIWKKNGTEIVAYRNRFTEPLNDVATHKFIQGDVITVSVQPNDGLLAGNFVNSHSVVIKSKTTPIVTLNTPPFINDNLMVTQSNGETKYNAAASTVLSASFIGGPALNTDISQYIVLWYLKDGTNVFYTGKTIPENMTQIGQILSYTVQPYDGLTYGVISQSPNIIITK